MTAQPTNIRPSPLRFHQLKQMALSPAHLLEARARADVPDEETEQTPSMEKGSALHSVVFHKRPVIFYPGKMRAGKVWEAFEAEHAGYSIVTRAAYDKIMGMAEAIWSCRIANELLFATNIVHEQTLHFDLHGHRCRGTPDARLGAQYIVDLKSAKSSEPERFMRQAQNMLYHAQLAFYARGVEAAGLGRCRDTWIIAVESTAPYCVTPIPLTERTLDQGDRCIRLWFERLAACEAVNFYPPYTQTPIPWDIEEELELQYADEEPMLEAANA